MSKPEGINRRGFLGMGSAAAARTIAASNAHADAGKLDKAVMEALKAHMETLETLQWNFAESYRGEYAASLEASTSEEDEMWLPFFHTHIYPGRSQERAAALDEWLEKAAKSHAALNHAADDFHRRTGRALTFGDACLDLPEECGKQLTDAFDADSVINFAHPEQPVQNFEAIIARCKDALVHEKALTRIEETIFARLKSAGIVIDRERPAFGKRTPQDTYLDAFSDALFEEIQKTKSMRLDDAAIDRIIRRSCADIPVRIADEQATRMAADAAKLKVDAWRVHPSPDGRGAYLHFSTRAEAQQYVHLVKSLLAMGVRHDMNNQPVPMSDDGIFISKRTLERGKWVDSIVGGQSRAVRAPDETAVPGTKDHYEVFVSHDTMENLDRLNLLDHIRSNLRPEHANAEGIQRLMDILKCLDALTRSDNHREWPSGMGVG